MFPGGKNMKDLMKQAQKMQAEMMKSQQELENKIYETSAGGGVVTGPREAPVDTDPDSAPF